MESDPGQVYRKKLARYGYDNKHHRLSNPVTVELKVLAYDKDRGGCTRRNKM